VRDDEGAEDALLVAVGFLAGGPGFKGTVERSVADLAVPVVLKEEVERERDARAEGEPETDVGRFVTVERAGPVDMFDEGNEARKLGGTDCTACCTPVDSNKISSNEVDNEVVAGRLVVELEPWTWRLLPERGGQE
jgi:hypothetical protein